MFVFQCMLLYFNAVGRSYQLFLKVSAEYIIITKNEDLEDWAT